MDYLLPKEKYNLLSAYLCVAVGSVSSLAVSIVNQYLDRMVQPDPQRFWLSCEELRFFVVSRVFTLASLYADITLWKGYWAILDDAYVTYHRWACVVLVASVLCFLIAIGSLRVVMGAPLGTGFMVDIDTYYM